MISGIDSIVKDIEIVFKSNSIFEPVELTYSQLSSVDIQCNNLVKLYADNII